MTIQNSIENKLSALNPIYLQVFNESHMHSVPENSETHFKVVMVSDQFIGTRLVKRHQQIYGALKDELAGPVHALALHLYTPEEWPGEIPQSPDCMGGNGK
ncbi:MAG: BolA/IbaG family iron-sulfur metabolism protein [Reinekea sp.]|jgi:BolA family transcriptional regulator, general stress-responsive regulator